MSTPERQESTDIDPRLIEDLLGRLGLKAQPSQVASLVRFVGELMRWTRRVDLTGARTPEAFVSGPLFDALTVAPLVVGAGTFLDVGSGGGLPGIPLGLLRPDLKLTLLEPRSRRAAFLRHACGLLGLEAQVIEGRLEDVAGATYDHAVAQAVWPPAEWLERASLVGKARGAVYVLGSSPLPETVLPQGAVMEEERAFQGRSLPRFTARVRLP